MRDSSDIAGNPCAVDDKATPVQGVEHLGLGSVLFRLHLSSMSALEILLLSLSSAAAGAINSIAGGGTLLTFPALIWSLGGTDASFVIANATSTIALCPGSFSSAWAYRRELPLYRHALGWLVPPSLLGSVLGTWILLHDKPDTFKLLVPWLILVATLLFALQPQIARWTGQGQKKESLSEVELAHAPSSARRWTIMGFAFLIGVYGGYFGAGIGILTLSALALLGMNDIHGMNAVKTIIASLINLVAIAFFVAHDLGLTTAGGEQEIAQVIDWPRAIPMIFAGIAGGYLGASVARRMNKNVVRRIVVLIGFALAAKYFYQLFTEDASPHAPIKEPAPIAFQLNKK
jgi:uncharacterized membrane protein YfcA